MPTSKPVPPPSDQQSLFAADTHANHFHKQEGEKARRMKDISGRKCLELYEISGRDGSLPKMLLGILASVSTKLPHRWKLKASPSGRLLFQLAPLMHLTDETDFGFWPTIRATDGERGGRGDLIQAVRCNPNKHYKMWPTPHGFSKDGKSNGPSGNELGRAVNHSLWPTPKGTASGPDYARVNRPNSGGDDLATAVARISAGSLNPQWVEWLMGYPIGWTDLKRSEMPLSPKSRKR